MKSTIDCVIIGSGVAGMTAAIYLKRAGLNIVLLEKSAPGGQINMTANIENYPGFEKIDGPTLAMNMFNQVRTLEVPYKYGTVLEITDKETYKIVKTDLEEYETKTVLITSGRQPKELGLEHEKQLIGRGISWCALCDGTLYKNLEVAVVGGGNSALEEAMYLANICSKVYLIHRRDTFRAEKHIQEKLTKYKNIEILFNSEVTKLNEADSKLESIDVNGKKLSVNALFIYIGYEPDTKFIDVKKDNKYLIVNDLYETSIKGIYAAGDVISKGVYQISTSVGDAANAANNIIKEIYNK